MELTQRSATNMSEEEFITILRTLTEEERLTVYELLKVLQECPAHTPSSPGITDETD